MSVLGALLPVSLVLLFVVVDALPIAESSLEANPLLHPRATCTPCPRGFYMPPGNETCGPACPPGSCNDTKNCLPCSTGTFNDELNASSCKSCQPGWVATQPGQTECSPCASGETSSSSSSFCTPCKPGYSNSRTGSTCTPCKPGQFSSVYKSLSCTSCPGGTYNNLQGQPSCSSCGKGRYNPYNGSTSFSSCITCPKKYFCSVEQTVSPKKCPSNHYCESGSAKPSVCPVLYESDRMSTSCEPSAWFFVIIALGCLVLVVFGALLLGFLAYKAFRRANDVAAESVTPSNMRSEVEKMVPEPLPGPVYQGF